MLSVSSALLYSVSRYLSRLDVVAHAQPDMYVHSSLGPKKTLVSLWVLSRCPESVILNREAALSCSTVMSDSHFREHIQKPKYRVLGSFVLRY